MNQPDSNDVFTALDRMKKTKNSIWEISDKGRKWLATVKSMGTNA